MAEKRSKISADDKRMVREAVREGLDEMATAYTNGALKFTNALADSWAGVIDAFDNFFLENLANDRPEVARTIINARISSAKRATSNLQAKIRTLEARARKLGE
jgi:hypothetical protein